MLKSRKYRKHTFHNRLFPLLSLSLSLSLRRSLLYKVSNMDFGLFALSLSLALSLLLALPRRTVVLPPLSTSTGSSVRLASN
jgi:hypothetical protein